MSEISSTNTGADAKSQSNSQKGRSAPLGRPPRGDKGSDTAAAHGITPGLAALPGFSLLSFSGPVETASTLPGRTRFVPVPLSVARPQEICLLRTCKRSRE